MGELREAVIVDALRTPFGRAHKQLGFLRQVRSDDLGVTVLDEPGFLALLDEWDLGS